MSAKNLLKRTALNQYLRRFRWRERKISRGNDFPDKTFYVIRRHANRAGLFSFVMTNLASIQYAIDHQYIPIVDMQNSPNPMLKNSEVGRINAWDQYFDQPCGYTLEDIKKAKHIILGDVEAPSDYPDYSMLQNKGELRRWQQMAQRYLHPLSHIEAAASRWLEQNGGVKDMLGVLCRGTDYIQSKPLGHPIQPDIEDVLEECTRISSQYGLNKIYLATEDEEIFGRFEMAFPDKVFSYQQTRVTTSAGENVNDRMNAMSDPYARNQEYLISIDILSKLSYFVGGATNGSYGALLMGAGQKYHHIWQLGCYGGKEDLLGTKTGIVILNYKSAQLCLNAVDSVRKNVRSPYHIYLVDGNSGNSEEKILRSSFQNSSDVTLKILDKNPGYSVGNNVGARLAVEDGCERILIMNPDVELQNDIVTLLGNGLSDRIAMSVPYISLPDGRCGQKLMKNFRIRYSFITKIPLGDKIARHFAYFRIARNISNPKEMMTFSGTAMGCCLMINSKIFDRLGMFDENVFLYFEENILGLKLERQRLLTSYIPEARIIHHESSATGKAGMAKKYCRFYSSEYYVLKRWCGIGRLMGNIMRYLLLREYDRRSDGDEEQALERAELIHAMNGVDQR
jgi:GT2 family glycosyltransferase